MIVKEFKASMDVSEPVVTVDLFKQISKWAEEAYAELKNPEEFEKFLIPPEIFGLFCLFGNKEDMTYLVSFSTDIKGESLLHFHAGAKVKEK